MQNTLYGLRQAWRAECLKLKGSHLFWLLLLLGLAAPVLFTVVTIAENGDDPRSKTPRLPFNYFVSQLKMLFPAYGSFLFPLTLIISTSRICGMEYKADTWKLVETQPVSRLSVWIVKFGMAAWAALLAILVFLLAGMLCFTILSQVHAPHPAASLQPPLFFMATMTVRLWLTGMGIIVLQLALSMLLRSNTWPVVIGVVALIVTNIAAANDSTLASFWPYALSNYSIRYPDGSEAGYLFLPSEWQGLLWLLVAPFGYLLYRYRGAFRHSFRNSGLWLVVLCGFFVFAAASWWVQAPKTAPLLDGRTVVAGSIKGTPLPDSVEVLSASVNLPLQKVAVQPDGSFHMNIELSGDVEELVVRLENNFAERIYAGSGDSVFLSWQLGDVPGLQEMQLSGTAVATNRYLALHKEMWSSVRYQIVNPANYPEPDIFFKELVNEWKDKDQLPRKFRTADGMGLSSKVRALQEKLIAVDYLNMALYEYPTKKMINRNDAAFIAATQRLRPLFEKIQPLEAGLVGWPRYHEYLYNRFTENYTLQQTKDSVYYHAILQQPKGHLQDRLLYDFANKQLEATRDSAARASILQEMAVIGDVRLRQKLEEQVAVMNRVRRGQLAPLMQAHTLVNDTASFEVVAGKHVVVDVWATWCAPCREMSPIFERMAEKYKDKPVVFIALNVDDNRQAWEQEVRSKRSPVLQWRVLDNKDFAGLYGLSAIPRFLLLDAQGRFVNAFMPRPNDSNFERLLRQALQLPEEEG